MLMERQNCQLLLIDVQERLLPSMAGCESLLLNCRRLLEASAELDIPLTISEQYRKGLGETEASLLAASGHGTRFDKLHFGCAGDPEILFHLTGLKGSGRRQVVVAGIETHVCVLQTALGLVSADFDVFVVADAVTSRTERNRDLALDRMARAGVPVVSTEMVLFEWLQVAGTDAFRTVSQLIR